MSAFWAANWGWFAGGGVIAVILAGLWAMFGKTAEDIAGPGGTSL